MRMKAGLQILSTELLSAYLKTVPPGLEHAFSALHDADISTDAFSFYASVASVYSSKIEGESIELDSYIKYKKFGIEFLPDYTKKTDDLYSAYQFASGRPLSEANLTQAHQLLTAHVLPEHLRGVARTNNMYVIDEAGKIEYVAVSPYLVKVEMEKLYHDLQVLLNAELSFPETMFFAAMLHLVFVKIHPWSDGNGRCARLLEKWFLAEKVGEKAWFLDSEKWYYNNKQAYYASIRTIGNDYETLSYSKALPFLLMLPASLAAR